MPPLFQGPVAAHLAAPPLILATVFALTPAALSSAAALLAVLPSASSKMTVLFLFSCKRTALRAC